MKKRSTITLATVLLALVAQSAVPLRWTVETSRVQPVSFDAYHGETLELEATLQSYGKPVSDDLQDARIYWQTNGMGSLYWSAPASAEGGVLRAMWTPAMDTGANAVNGFIGVAGEIYRAAFSLRLRPSPGAEPNLLTVPPAILDLANTTVINAPWPTDETIKAVVREVVDETGIQAGVDEDEVKGIVRDTVTKGYVESLGISSEEKDPSVPGWAKNPSMPSASDIGALSEKASSNEGSGWLYWLDEHTLSGVSFNANFPGDVSAAAGSISLSDTSNKASEALAYAYGVYNYMHADENAWFSGTNYVFSAEAASRHKFAFEPGMDLGSVPCSMALIEKRDGVNQTVWDQRDWTSWYWAFKAGQLRTEIAATNAVIYGVISGKADKAWSKHTSASGRDNPDTTTTWVETESVTIAPGMAWETVATVSGCSYWTIVGDGARIGGNGSDSVHDITDFEGNSVMRITKTASYMTYLECGSEIYTSGRDDQGRVTFTMRASVKPTAEFTADLHEEFVGEDDAACPAVFEWESVSANVWRIHFLAKPGATACFAKFKVEVEGSTTVEYANAPTINGGLIFNGRKIAPVIPAGAKVGDTITWKVVQ